MSTPNAPQPDKQSDKKRFLSEGMRLGSGVPDDVQPQAPTLPHLVSQPTESLPSVAKKGGRPATRISRQSPTADEIQRHLHMGGDVQLVRSKRTERSVGCKVDEMIIQRVGLIAYKNRLVGRKFSTIREITEDAYIRWIMQFDNGEIDLGEEAA